MDSLEPLLPSLQNLPVFFTIVCSLLLMAGLSGFVLYRRPPGPAVVWLKVCALLPLWLLGLVWFGVTLSMGVFAGAVAGSGLLVLLALGLVPAYALLNWGLYHWIRGSHPADAGMLLLVSACLLGVYGVQRLWLCEPLAHSGLGLAQLCTARLYEQGGGGALQRQDIARVWYRQAAEQGVAEAEYRVAGFTRDPDEKTGWLSRAAGHGHAGADYQLYWLLETADPGAAMRHLQTALRYRHAGAQYRMGLLFRNGQGDVDRDLPQTRRLWLQAAAGGYISAMRELAIAYATDGILFDYDPQASRRWERRAHARAETAPDIPRIEEMLAMNWEQQLQAVRSRRERAGRGDEAAQLALGREILQQARGEPVLVDKAMGWIERAAQAGAVEAQFQLAEHYLTRTPASKAARAQGRQWLTAAADGGHESALREMITALKQASHGFARDLHRARDYSEALFGVLEARGVLANDPEWQAAGWEYSDTRNQMEQETRRYLPADELRRQSAAGDPAARYHLGRELLSTRYDEGMALMTAAAMAGYPQAQYEVASVYRHGKRTEQEERQAIEWLQAAADSGHRGAMVDLGVVYLQGIRRIALERDPYRARRLFEAALSDREDAVYEQPGSSGRGWKYTVDTVHRWLDRIPEAVMRLDLEGLEGKPRQRAIEAWYRREQQALRAKTPAPKGEALASLQQGLDELTRQRTLLLAE